MIVIAVIVILSGATAIGVVSWLNNAKDTAADLEARNGENFENEARETVKNIAGSEPGWNQPTETLEGTNQQTQATQVTQSTQQQTQQTKETQGTRETKETQGTTQTQQTQETQASTTATTKASGSGGVSVPSNYNYVLDEHGNPHGVVGMTSAPTTSGNTTTLYITDLNGYNKLTISIEKKNDGYYIHLGNAQYNLQGNNGFPNYVNNQGDYKLDAQQKAWLASNYGVTVG